MERLIRKSALACSPAPCAAKPNVIVIVADDFGYECVTAIEILHRRLAVAKPVR